MMSWLPRPVTANVTCSMWSQYHRTMSHTSEMLPALFSIPSTLYTGMGWPSFFVVRLFFVDRTVPVSVICIEIGSLRDFEPGVIGTMCHLGSCFPISDVTEVVNVEAM